MKISEIITDKYKLRIPPTVYYDLLADVWEVEEEQEPTTKNNLGVDCISRQAVIDSLYDWSNHSMTDAETWHLRQVIGDIKSMPSVTPQEPKTGHWIPSHIPESILDECSECGFSCGAFTFNYCPNCGAKMESEDKE